MMKTEADKPGRQWKKQSVAKLVGISIMVSLFVNFAYLTLETICVKVSGNLPIKNVLYGGECMEYEGVFGGITILCPMTSSDEPHVSATPILRFSIFNFIGAIILLSFVTWLVLLLINRYFKLALILVGSIAGISLAVIGGKKEIERWEETPVALTSITVITADLHSGVYNSMSYPKQVASLVVAGEGQSYGYSKNESIADCISPENMNGKQLQALIKTAQKVKEHTNTDQTKDFAYRFKIIYKTRGGGHKNLQIIGYDSFPEEWGEFIRTINEACGMHHLRENPEMVTFSKEWFCDTYGIHDQDMPEGLSVDQFIEKYNITMQRLSGMNPSSWDYQILDIQRPLEDYLASSSGDT
jgi:hypothetical protein